MRGVSQNDLTIIKDGSKITNWSLKQIHIGDTEIVFQDTIQYSATINKIVTSRYKNNSWIITNWVQPPDQAYDYSRLGETWFMPRIFQNSNKGEAIMI